MKLKNLFMLLAFAATISLVACNGDEDTDDPDTDNTEETTENNTPEVTPNAALTVAIHGMVCNVACPDAIKKGYEDCEGVTTAIAEYNEETQEGTMIVEYDNNITNEEKILAHLETIDQGQYHKAEVEEMTEEPHEH